MCLLVSFYWATSLIFFFAPKLWKVSLLLYGSTCDFKSYFTGDLLELTDFLYLLVAKTGLRTELPPSALDKLFYLYSETFDC